MESRKSFRWLPYLAFTLLLFAASIALGVLVFQYKMSQLSDYLLLVRPLDPICDVANTIKSLNLVHPRTISGYISFWRDPSKPNHALKRDSPSNSISALVEPSSRSTFNSTCVDTPEEGDPNWPAQQYHIAVMEIGEQTSKQQRSSPYNRYGGKGEGFV
jgi:hypothetical protein